MKHWDYNGIAMGETIYQLVQDFATIHKILGLSFKSMDSRWIHSTRSHNYAVVGMNHPHEYPAACGYPTISPCWVFLKLIVAQTMDFKIQTT